jgi:hypothetical protein
MLLISPEKIYGSNLFNITLIALIDLLQGRGPLKAQRKRSLIVTALLSITNPGFI